MIISFGGKEYVSGEPCTAEDILAAYEQGLRNGKWEAEEAENALELKKKGHEEGYDGGFEDGYNTAIKEMFNNQALGETTEYEFGTEDCCGHHNPNKETQEAMQEVLDRADAVSSPKHYNSDPSGIQCIEITRHRNNNIGNVFKYLWRNGLKDGNSDIQDLEKGAWYLNDEIQRLKGLRDD